MTETRFAIALRSARGEAQLTAEQLAEASGVAVQTIAAIEQSRVKQPQPVTLGRLSRALGCSVAELEGRAVAPASIPAGGHPTNIQPTTNGAAAPVPASIDSDTQEGDG